MNAKESLEALALAIVGNVISDRIVKAMDARAKEKAPKPEEKPKHLRDEEAR